VWIARARPSCQEFLKLPYFRFNAMRFVNYLTAGILTYLLLTACWHTYLFTHGSRRITGCQEDYSRLPSFPEVTEDLVKGIHSTRILSSGNPYYYWVEL